MNGSTVEDTGTVASVDATRVEEFRFVEGGVQRMLAGRTRERNVTVEVIRGPVHDDPRLAYQSALLRRCIAPAEADLPEASFVDLFAGCGGLSVGAHEAARAAGFRPSVPLAVEMAEPAAAVYAANFRPAVLDIRPIEELVGGAPGASLSAGERRLASQYDGLTMVLAGPPCQGNSDLNNHTRRNDPKNALYLRAARFIEVVRPMHAVIENVPGVVHDRGGVVGAAVAALQSAGYRISAGIVGAHELGAPQKRRRHLLIASRDPDVVPRIEESRHAFAAPPTSVMSAISDLSIEPSRGPFGTPATHSSANRRRIEYLFQHGLYELPDEERPDCHRLKAHSYVSVYGRMYPEQPAPTITAGFGSTGQGRFVHPHEPRTLTPHEAARVQGFPDWFSFDNAQGRRDLQKMIGNAVPTRLAFAAVASVLR